MPRIIYFIIDTLSPNIEILSPESKIYTTSSVPLNLTIDEWTSWIGYNLDGQANMTISGNTTLSGLSDGSHSLIVYAKDTVGNTEASEMVSFTVETQLSEPFPLWTIGAIVMIAGVVVALLIYFTKVKKTTEKVQISFFWFCYNFSEFLTFTNLQYADSMKW